MYLVHMGVASEAFFYQQVLRQWGNLSSIRLGRPVSIAELYAVGRASLATHHPRGVKGDTFDCGYDRCVEDGDESAPGSRLAHFSATEVAARAVSLLDQKAEMLLEYALQCSKALRCQYLLRSTREGVLPLCCAGTLLSASMVIIFAQSLSL